MLSKDNLFITFSLTRVTGQTGPKEFDPSKSSVLRLLQEEQKGYPNKQPLFAHQSHIQQMYHEYSNTEYQTSQNQVNQAYNTGYMQNQEDLGSSEF